LSVFGRRMLCLERAQPENKAKYVVVGTEADADAVQEEFRSAGVKPPLIVITGVPRRPHFRDLPRNGWLASQDFCT
jgi:hypothetical protein